MLDWKKIVREKLGDLPLNSRRQEEIIEELALQLESSYEEAVAGGASEEAALRQGLAQFPDWRKLRGEVYRSVEGMQLPVWEQDGIFSPRRLPVWLALALTLVLLLFPAFRQALEIFVIPSRMPTAWSPGVFSDKTLRGIERSGDKQKYARALAFVALHSPDDLQALHAAEKVITLDPQFTWISAHVSHAAYLVPGYDPNPWIERLKAWDPQNAFPYILEADASVYSEWESRWAKYNAATPELRRALAAEPRWRVPMEKAFDAPRIDSYETQQFALDRQVLEEQGLDRPDMLLSASLSQSIPDYFAIKTFAEIQLTDVGVSAEKTGHTEQALAAYWGVVRFGARLGQGSADIAQWFSVKLREDAYKRIIPLLQRQGHKDETAAIEAALTALPALDPHNRPFRAPFESSATRSAHIVSLSAYAVGVFGIASIIWLMTVITLKWKPGLSRRMNHAGSALACSPALLAVASMALLIGYYPYAHPIGQFASPRDLHEAYGPLFMGLYSLRGFIPGTDMWLRLMFWPSISCAGIALSGALLLWWVARRKRPDRTGAV